MADFSEVTVALLFISTTFYSGCEIMTEDKCNNFLHLHVKVVKTILGFRLHRGDVDGVKIYKFREGRSRLQEDAFTSFIYIKS